MPVKREIRIGEIIVIISFVVTMIGGVFATKYQIKDTADAAKKNSQFIVDASRETIRMFREASAEIQSTNKRVDVLERKQIAEDAYNRGLHAGGQ